MIQTDDIIKIANYFTIIAHSPGRLRVRVNPKIKNESDSISISDIEELPKKIAGIKDIKVKKVIASVTITYDPQVFKPTVWEDLISHRNLDEITEIINNLAKEVM